MDLLTAAGKSDVDNASQVAALADMTEEGAKGIMIVPARSRADRARDREGARRRRDRGRPRHADSAARRPSRRSYATNNRRAGNLIGRYAKAKAEEDGVEPRIAMLDLAPGISVGELRHNGFLNGFGIRDGDPEIVGPAYAEGNEDQAREAMARAAG